MNTFFSFSFLKQILITSRPAGWTIFLVSYLGGFLVSQREFANFDFFYLALIVPILSFALYSINDIYDYDSDLLNQRKKLIIMGGLLEKRYWQIFRRLCFLSCALVLIYPIFFGNWTAFLFSALGLLIGVGYSLPPLRFKTIPGGDIAANTAGFACLFIVGLSSNFSQALLLTALPYLIYSSMMVMAWSCLCLSLDQEADSQAKHKTTSVRLGKLESYRLKTLTYLICGFIMWLYFHNTLAVLLFLSAILSAFGYWQKSLKWKVVLIVGITILNVIAYASIYWPFFQNYMK